MLYTYHITWPTNGIGQRVPIYLYNIYITYLAGPNP